MGQRLGTSLWAAPTAGGRAEVRVVLRPLFRDELGGLVRNGLERDLLQPFQNRRVHVCAPTSEHNGNGALAEAVRGGSPGRPGRAVVADGLIDWRERREDIEQAAVVKFHIGDLTVRLSLVDSLRVRRRRR